MQSFLKGLCGGLEGAEPLEVEVGGRAREGGREGGECRRQGPRRHIPLARFPLRAKVPFPAPCCSRTPGLRQPWRGWQDPVSFSQLGQT